MIVCDSNSVIIYCLFVEHRNTSNDTHTHTEEESKQERDTPFQHYFTSGTYCVANFYAFSFVRDIATFYSRTLCVCKSAAYVFICTLHVHVVLPHAVGYNQKH